MKFFLNCLHLLLSLTFDMRVLIVNTSERAGGAAVAACRLMDALNNNGVKAKMLVRDKESSNISVADMGGGMMTQRHFLRERLAV